MLARFHIGWFNNFAAYREYRTDFSALYFMIGSIFYEKLQLELLLGNTTDLADSKPVQKSLYSVSVG